MNILRTLFKVFARSHRVSAKQNNDDRFTRLKAVAASGQSGCRAAQQRLREATHAGLRQAVGK